MRPHRYYSHWEDYARRIVVVIGRTNVSRTSMCTTKVVPLPTNSLLKSTTTYHFAYPPQRLIQRDLLNSN